MKLYVSILLSLLLINSVCADVTIINQTKKYNMEVTYVICTNLGDSRPCTDNQSITIRAGENNYSKIDISVPIISPDKFYYQEILIFSAVEKDTDGKVIAQGFYRAGQGADSHCAYRLISGSSRNNVPAHDYSSIVIELNDDYPIPIISCQPLAYNVEELTVA
jgi:hypothetical protein